MKPFSDSWVRNIEVDGGIKKHDSNSLVGAIGWFSRGDCSNRRFIFDLVEEEEGQELQLELNEYTSQEPDPHIRSRNVGFYSKWIKTSC